MMNWKVLREFLSAVRILSKGYLPVSLSPPPYYPVQDYFQCTANGPEEKPRLCPHN